MQLYSKPESGRCGKAYLLALTLCMALTMQCSGQQAAGFGIEASALAGKVFKHEAKFTLPIPDLSTGADVNLLWYTYGRKAWQQRRGYPRLGLGSLTSIMVLTLYMAAV